jgi:hypothetical protein
MSDKLQVYGSLSVYNDRYGISVSDTGSVYFYDLKETVNGNRFRKLTLDEAVPVLTEYWKKKQASEEFNRGIIEATKERVKEAFSL